jgi:outer membrane protein assembly factor BamB
MKNQKNKTKLTSITFVLVLAFAALMVSIPTINATNDNLRQYEWPLPAHDPERTGFTECPGPSTNHTLWQTQLGGPHAGCNVVADGKVFIGTINPDNTLYAVDAFTGEILWTHENLRNVYFPIYANGKIYGTQDQDTVFCLDANTGDLIWDYLAYAAWFPLPVDGKVFYSDGGANKTNYIIALDANTGDLIWEYNTTHIGNTRNNAYGADKFFAGVNDYWVVAVDAETGNLVWEYEIGSEGGLPGAGYAIGGMTYKNGAIYYGGNEISIDCLDAETGKLLWDLFDPLLPIDEIPKGIQYGGSGLAVAYDKVYAGSLDQNVYAIDQSGGAILWRFKTGGPIVCGVSLSGDGKVYFGSADFNVYCLDANTGEQIWKYKTTAVVSDSIAIAYGNAYAMGNDGILRCFGLAAASSLSLSAPTSIKVGESLTVSGKLDDEAGVGISGANVTLRYKVAPLTEWKKITTVTTTSDGSYSYMWTPPYDGYYDINAFSQELDLGGYASSTATSTLRVAPTAAEVEVDLTPVTEALSDLAGSVEGLESTTSTLTTYLIAIVVLVVVGIAISAYALLRTRK